MTGKDYILAVALPVAAFLAWRYRSNWFGPTSVVAFFASGFMLFGQLLGAWLLSDIDVRSESYYLLSSVIDIIKVGAILLLITALLEWVLAPRTTTT